MPEFAYIARDLTGNRVEGTLAAGTEREVLASLSARELFPLKVASAGPAVVRALQLTVPSLLRVPLR